MAPKFEMVELSKGIPTIKQVWPDDITNPEKAEEDEEPKVKEYVRQLAERTLEVTFLKVHAHKIAKHAMRLQQAEAQAREQAKKADDELEREFRELADQWYEETMFLSSTSDILSKETYYQIVALGRKIIPLILCELQERGGHWFLALRVLTKDNPVRQEDRGNMRKMTQAWLDWGKEHNHI